jgi:hypothetical protein
MMPKRVKVYVATVALVLAALGPALLSGSAGASTAACGAYCTSLSVESLGTGEVLTVSGGNLEMATASTTSTAQDLTPMFEGDVTDAAEAGVVSSKLEMNYGGDTLVEYQYAPGGVPSDSCVADTSQNTIPTNTPTLSVALEPCGTTAQSLWIVDGTNEADGYVDLINAGYETAYSFLAPDSNTDTSNTGLTSLFAEPYVLTVSSSGKLALAPLSELGGVVSTSQMWANWSSPDQSEVRKAVQAQHLKSMAKFG